MKKYALFIGRWQTWHKGKNVWIAIRDFPHDENNPKSAQEVLMELTNKLKDKLESGRLYISIIPDIESVNYGRYVGYDVIYHEPPTEIGLISGTNIRNGSL
jgi:nicotinamide mononucleotide adenylyltransferase